MRILRTWALVAFCIVGHDLSAQAEDPCAEGALTKVEIGGDHTLVLRWEGSVRESMDRQIKREFERAQASTRNVLLMLSSCGGDTLSMRKTIAVLRHIKQTHSLTTRVAHGDTCSSACIPVFLQGTTRIAALTSTWLWHQASVETSEGDTIIRRRADAAATDRVMEDYFVPAGVSKRWLKRVRAKIVSGDYWQTGRDLWESNSGIITNTLGNLEKRDPESRVHLQPGVVCGAMCRG
jgi:hypothetical protein